MYWAPMEYGRFYINFRPVVVDDEHTAEYGMGSRVEQSNTGMVCNYSNNETLVVGTNGSGHNVRTHGWTP